MTLWALSLALLLFIPGSPLHLRAAHGAGAPVTMRQEPDTIPVRLDSGRFTIVAYPTDLQLARSLLAAATADDTFPGLPRPTDRVLIGVAPDARRFREWIGPSVPEWGAAVAIPSLQRIYLRGRGAGATVGGDPRTVLRHELAHLALHEALGDLPPRWFDEGYASYAAGEWGRGELLATNRALLFRRFPSLRTLDDQLTAGSEEARGAYALSYRAVAELAAMDPERGLTLFFEYWGQGGRLEPAVRRAYGITLDGFEERWQQRTRSRYGVLALVGDFTVAALILLVLVVPLVVVRRRRDGERLRLLRQADAVVDARAAEARRTVEALVEEAAATPTGACVEETNREPGPAVGDLRT